MVTTDTEVKVICKTCNRRIADHQVINGKVYWRDECLTCRRERLNLPKHYGKGILSPRKRLAVDKVTHFGLLLFHICERCGWYGYCHIHHKDGNCNNNNKQNLQTLCPNCHTDVTWGKPKLFENLPQED